MKIALATTNPGKIAEIKAALSFGGLKWVTDDGHCQWPAVVESGSTFYENALIKARAIAEFLQMPALADDSGLEVEALGGKPGVWSARYAGSGATDADNIAKLMKEIKNVPDEKRRAKFSAVMALVWPGGKILTTTGECPGTIGWSPRGQQGFGYDPIFIPNGHDRTLAELAPEEKNRLSHRGKALRAMWQLLEKEIGGHGHAT